jgi:Ca-activated chloride channel family protein
MAGWAGREGTVKRACLLLVCLSVFDAKAQVPVFRAEVDLVALNVVVTDGEEKYVTGLAPADFAVYEDGVQQDVSFFGSADVPLDLAILLDTSSSMAGKLQIAQQAAVGLVSTLRPGDRATVVDIKDATKIVFPLGGNVEAAKHAILATAPGGGTALYNGTYLALKEMSRQARQNGDVRRQAIVLLSDGADTASLLSFDDVMDVAKRSGIAVYTVSLTSQAESVRASSQGRRYFSQSDFSMRALAQETGAKSFFPVDVNDLPKIYSAIADELATQYALGYTSKNPKIDGTYRRVVVRVTAMPNLRTRTRAGYLSARLGSLNR